MVYLQWVLSTYADITIQHPDVENAAIPRCDWKGCLTLGYGVIGNSSTAWIDDIMKETA